MLETRRDIVPRLRSDLIISRQVIAGVPAYVVKDPAANRFFRFRELEGYLLDHLDGKTDVEALRQKVEAEFHTALRPATLEGFLAKLGDLKLLAGEGGATAATATARYPVRGDIFYLRFKGFDPDALLDRLAGRLSFLFTPAFVAVSALGIAAAVLLTVADWPEIQRELPRLLNVSSLALAYLTMLAVIAAHEFAHGLTCKYFGGSVREMGFMLIYFQPAFFCNVSDAWLFPEKSRRLWVTFAGAYFEIFVWATATMLWRLTDPFTLVNYMSLVVMATSGFKTLFNLNPLIKLDGYYLLSDYLEVPNLRRRAFAWWSAGFRRWTGRQSAPAGAVVPRERRIFFIYGLLAGTYSLALFLLVASALGGFLMTKYRGWGFIGFSLLLLAVFRAPLKKLLNASSRPVLNTAMRARMARWLWLAAIGVAVAALFLVRMDLRVGGEVNVLPVRNADVRAAVDGVIAEVHADEGDTVARGDLIVSLSERDFQAELGKVKAQREEALARLNLLKAGSRPEEIELARTLVTKAEERVRYARERLGMDDKLVQQNLLSQRELNDTREQMDLRNRELEEAQEHLRVLLAGSRAEEVEATAAEVRRLEAEQCYLEEQISLLKVTSPIDGVVVTHKLKDRLGEAVHKGDLIAKVHELRTVSVEIAVPESEIADVKVGQPVVVRTRAYPDRSFHGVVAAVAPVVTKPEGAHAERYVLVTTRFDNPDYSLKPEMTGNAKISCGKRRLVDLVLRRFLRFVKVEFWSWW